MVETRSQKQDRTTTRVTRSTPTPPVPQEASPSTPEKGATPTEETSSTTPSTTPVRGENVYNSNKRSQLSFGTQKLLLQRILASGGIAFVENRLNSVICKGREDLFGDHGRHPIRRAVYDKVCSWKNLDAVKFNLLCARFGLSPLEISGGDTRALEITDTTSSTSKSTKK
jgi:hypothetical protein